MITTWPQFRRWLDCWDRRHELTVYVSPWEAFPALVACDCGKVLRPANIKTMSERRP